MLLFIVGGRFLTGGALIIVRWMISISRGLIGT
jgi:hypothetical protein